MSRRSCALGAAAAPCLHERAVAGPVLQAHGVKAGVQGGGRRSVRAAAAQQRVLQSPPAPSGGERARAVHRRVCKRGAARRLAAPHLEPARSHRALDHIGRLHRKGLQEEDAVQRLARRRRSRRRARHLEVARAREDDAALRDVVGDERVQRAGDGRAEGAAAVG